MTRENFIEALIEKNLFWSYDTGNTRSIPDALIIEQTLRYGDVFLLKTLFELYDNQEIKKIWELTLLPDERQGRLNFYLAKFFFKIPDTKRWLLKNVKTHSRISQLKFLASQHPGKS